MPRRDYFVGNFQIMQAPPPPPPPPPPTPPPPAPIPSPTSMPVAGTPFTVMGMYNPYNLGLRLYATGPGMSWTDITASAPSGSFQLNFTLPAGVSYTVQCWLGIYDSFHGWLEYASAVCEFDVMSAPAPAAPYTQAPPFAMTRRVSSDDGAAEAAAQATKPPATAKDRKKRKSKV